MELLFWALGLACGMGLTTILLDKIIEDETDASIYTFFVVGLLGGVVAIIANIIK